MSPCYFQIYLSCRDSTTLMTIDIETYATSNLGGPFSLVKMTEIAIVDKVAFECKVARIKVAKKSSLHYL